MKDLLRFLQFNFIPVNKDLALLALRIWIGLTMLLNHGWGKLTKLAGGSTQFADPLGIGELPSLILATSAEAIGSALIVLGVLTRLSALGGITTMAVAFFIVHGHKLSGPGNGELAFVYLAAYVTLFFAGAGRYSLDAQMGAKS